MPEQSVGAEGTFVGVQRAAPASDWLQDLLRGVPRSLVTALALALVVVPALLTLLYIGLYGVNGPQWDHLTSAEIFERWDTGKFTLEYLFRAHNEHRKVVPRLVVLGFGKLTHFNNRAEMYLQWALLCGTVAILFAAFRRDGRLLDSWTRALLLFLPVSWLLTSVRPYEILLVGDGLLTYLSLIFFVAALSALAFGRHTRMALAGAIVFALLTSFSQSNGLLVWPIGLVLLLCDARVRPESRRVLAHALVWGIIGAVTIAGYFRNYQDPGNHPSPRYLLQRPYDALAHFMAVGGGSLSPEMRGAVAMGTLVLALECAMGLAILYGWWRRRERPPFGAWLVTCALATQIMIWLNRAGFGMGQGLSPRYAAYSCLAPIGLYWCLVVRRNTWRLAQPLAVALATMMTVGFISGTLDGWTNGRKWFTERAWQSYLLYSAKYQSRSLLEKLYPNPDHARVYAAGLERLGLNVFAEEHLRADRLAAISEAPPFNVDEVNGKPPNFDTPIVVSGDDPVIVSGWALDATKKRPAPTVFLTIDSTLDLPGHVGIERPDVARAFGSRPARWSGFTGSFSTALLAPGEHTVALKIVAADRAHAYVTGPLVRIIRK